MNGITVQLSNVRLTFYSGANQEGRCPRGLPDGKGAGWETDWVEIGLFEQLLDERRVVLKERQSTPVGFSGLIFADR
jgi:hypothetical protein